MQGEVISGLGKGMHFVSIEEYRAQFVNALGIDAYPGTLNLKAHEKSLRDLESLKAGRGIMISGFRKAGRMFGSVKAFRAEIEGIRCAFIIPERSEHTGVFEIIANKNLREELSLKDGTSVEVKIALDE